MAVKCHQQEALFVGVKNDINFILSTVLYYRAIDTWCRTLNRKNWSDHDEVKRTGGQVVKQLKQQISDEPIMNGRI